MTVQEFRDSLRREEPPGHLSFALAGLWWDAKGNWKQAHDLHRKEGDSSNAAYWYKRADKAPAESSLEQEWLEIVESLLSEAEPDS